MDAIAEISEDVLIDRVAENLSEETIVFCLLCGSPVDVDWMIREELETGERCLVLLPCFHAIAYMAVLDSLD